MIGINDLVKQLDKRPLLRDSFVRFLFNIPENAPAKIYSINSEWERIPRFIQYKTFDKGLVGFTPSAICSVGGYTFVLKIIMPWNSSCFCRCYIFDNSKEMK